jgi:hypothetical protein
MEAEFRNLRQTRSNFLKLVDGHSLATLNQIPVGYNNNLIWNLGHILVSTQLLVYKPAGVALRIEESLIEKYRRGSKPDGKVNSAEVERLRGFAISTLEALEADYQSGTFTQFEPYMTGYGIPLNSVEDALRFVPLHEAMHLGYSMALKRMLG